MIVVVVGVVTPQLLGACLANYISKVSGSGGGSTYLRSVWDGLMVGVVVIRNLGYSVFGSYI